MPAMPEPIPAEPVLFEAVSTPPRSFRPRGFVVMLALGLLWSLGGGAVFVLLGAWPVLPFLGVEVVGALVLVALHHRWSGQAREVVSLTRRHLMVRRRSGIGRWERAVLDPYWARVEWSERQGLALVQRGRRVPIGRFLSEEEQQDLAAALKRVLAEYRAPVFDNPQLHEARPHKPE
ncbi:hypothetical protein CR162_11220 [Pseudoroseomonas rhizosphaerae]|uniref:DUF2244 domain-containing protein n=1 Tax=Teichococcus rhizosphaerae TaxID=1335062 RepID=A0A2C6Y247_9PROT|nr:DUF2244 domain-containing protein [Pseudoroseomonas rhizosphaerae]PHK94852.1 hypothetical protein CR162_11220 [Pseudoroseomonas rhizosphaerae]